MAKWVWFTTVICRTKNERLEKAANGKATPFHNESNTDQSFTISIYFYNRYFVLSNIFLGLHLWFQLISSMRTFFVGRCGKISTLLSWRFAVLAFCTILAVSVFKLCTASGSLSLTIFLGLTRAAKSSSSLTTSSICTWNEFAGGRSGSWRRRSSIAAVASLCSESSRKIWQYVW